jgi:hypothetical protein
MKLALRTQLLKLPLLLLVAGSAACAATPGGEESGYGEDDLTSLTARTRTLKFSGVVFVREGATDAEILSEVRKQTQSAFGALRTADVGVNSRELKEVDPRTFVKTPVTVIDTNVPGDTGTPMLRVKYLYTDTALVPTTMATRSSLSLGLLGRGYAQKSARVLPECTDNDSHAREFQGSLWYVFNPSLASCKTAMASEQRAIDADRAKLADPRTQVPKSEVERLYIPMRVSLSRAAQNTRPVYPEYDRLYAGGVAQDKLVIGMVNGMMADWAAGEKHETYEDEGYGMWFGGLREIFAARPEMKLAKIEPAEDLTKLTVGGRTVDLPGGFDDIMRMELDREFPSGVSFQDQKAVRIAASQKVVKHWVTFEAPVKVTANGQTRDFTIVLQTYFGAETDPTPHKRAIRTSDIFVYNGHSYIGYGPLDPANFRSSDFPASYQVMMVNGCVSYNYYEKDYLPLKPGGTKNLDLVTNGLESWVNESGEAMGRFVAAFIDGKQNSYQEILKRSQFTFFGYDWGMDALRVVDGELDNTYSPSRTPIVVSAR